MTYFWENPVESLNANPYWVWEFNYPPRHRDRRLKGYEGPFRTRAEAQRAARRIGRGRRIATVSRLDPRVACPAGVTCTAARVYR